ncbi:MAG: hypothetical protein IKU62_08035 [Ruminiclostridium sp.]|nr:hypothetical protein [Ruminiclostridium sp.]
MSDDNNFSIGDILWEYADYTPPELETTAWVPLPPDTPEAPPAPTVQPGMPSPQPVSPPPAQPVEGKPVAPQPQADQPLPANQVPVKAAPKEEAKPAEPVSQPAPPPPAPQATPAPSAPAESQQEPVQTGLPESDGPEVIAFTPDPTPAEPAQPETPPAEPPAPEGTEAPAQGEPPTEEAQPQEGEIPAQEEEPASQEETPQPQEKEPEAPPKTGPTHQQKARQAAAAAAAAAKAASKDKFKLKRERKPRPQPPTPPDVPPAQLASELNQGLSAIKGKAVGAALVTGILLVLALVESGLLLFLDGVFPEELFLPMGMAAFVVAAILCGDVLKKGLVQLTHKAPNGDTLALFATLFALADGISLLAFDMRENTLPFFAPCALVLTFHLIGHYCTQSARYKACRVACSVAQPYVVTQDPNILNNQPAFRKWIGIPRGFGSQIRTLSDGEFRFQRLTPVLLVACIVLSLITTVAHHQPELAFWSLSALFCAASTLGVSLTFSLPMRVLGRKLEKAGAALAGWPGAVAAKGSKGALLQDYDIYPPGTITLMTARPFGNWNMERMTSYAASVVRASGSGLAYVFDRTMRNERGNYLQVEKLILQENGIVGTVQGQQVLVGNGDFMTRQGITLPEGVRAKDAVFCVIAREVAGMFVLNYNIHPTVLPALQALLAHRFNPILAVRDFNLNAQRLRLRGRLPVDQLSIPDLQRRVTLTGPNQVHSPGVVAVLTKEGLAPFAQAVAGAKRIRRAHRLATWMVNVSAVVGVFLTATLSSAAALSSMCAWNLSLFLLLWLVPVVLISLWTARY